MIRKGIISSLSSSPCADFIEVKWNMFLGLLNEIEQRGSIQTTYQ